MPFFFWLLLCGSLFACTMFFLCLPGLAIVFSPAAIGWMSVFSSKTHRGKKRPWPDPFVIVNNLIDTLATNPHLLRWLRTPPMRRSRRRTFRFFKCSHSRAHAHAVSRSTPDWLRIPWKHKRNRASMRGFNVPRLARLALLTTTVAMHANNAPARTAVFTTGTHPVRVDNCSSFCVSNDKHDFESLEPFQATVRGIGGALVTVHQRGTVRWKWENDLGQTTTHVIPNTLFMPTNPCRILSPQHWSQELKLQGDSTAHAITDHTVVTMTWGHGRHIKTMPLDSTANVGIFHTASGLTQTLQQFNNVVSDDDDDHFDPQGQDDIWTAADDATAPTSNVSGRPFQRGRSLQRGRVQSAEETHVSEGEVLHTHVPLTNEPRSVTFSLTDGPNIVPPDTQPDEEMMSPTEPQDLPNL